MRGRMYVLKPSGSEQIHFFDHKPSSAELESLLGARFESFALSRKAHPSFLFYDPKARANRKRFNVYASVMSGATQRVYGTAAVWVPGRPGKTEPSARELVKLVMLLEPAAMQSFRGKHFTHADWFTFLDALRHAIAVLEAGYRLP